MAPSTENTTTPVSCGVRVRTTGTELAGSFVNSCRTNLATNG